jgi:hypothetical protein
MGVTLNKWVDILKDEYLKDFVPSGGSAVKIAVVPPCDAESTISRVREEAISCGFLVAEVDAANIRVDKIEKIFHEVAKHVDWDALTERWLRKKLLENGILIDDDQPLTDLEAIAERNYTDKTDLLGSIQRLIQNTIFIDRNLSKEFRTAMTALCRGNVNPQNVSPSHSDIIKQWFLGEKCSLTELKKLQIYQRIARHNARHLLNSLARWSRDVGIRVWLLLLI